MYYQKKGGAWVFEEKDGIDKAIAEKIQSLLHNRELLKNAASHMMNGSLENDRIRFLNLIEQI